MYALSSPRPLSQPEDTNPYAQERSSGVRTLIVFAPGRNDPTLQRQHALLDRRFGRICDHGLHLIEVIGDTVAGAHDYASALRQRYAITHDRFGAVLIGRDGEIRLRADNPVDPGNFPPILRAVPAIR